MALRKPTEVDSVAVAIKPPISFTDVSKDTVKGLLFIVLIAIGYLYVDGKMNYNSQIEKQGKKIEKLESRIEILSTQLRKSDSTLSGAIATISILQQLGKIQ